MVLNAVEYLHRLEEIITPQIIIGSHHFGIDFSYGLAIYPDDGRQVDGLILVADSRMYADKTKGKSDL